MSETVVDVGLPRVVHVVETSWDAGRPLEIVINRGARDGVRLGSRFLVFGYGPEVTDPASGESLGRLEVVRGRGEIVHVQDQMATLRSVEERQTKPRRRLVRPGILGIPSTQLLEEEIPPNEPVGFEDVCVNDFAKPI